jgi:hypothetical protein
MNVSPIFLWKLATGKSVPADLCDEITDEHLEMWDRAWKPAMEAHCAGLPPEAEPEDSEWDWKANAQNWRKAVTYLSFAVVCEGELQGMMVTCDTKMNRAGKPMIYVELLATAPWNRPEIQTPKRYGGVGRALMLAAVELSRQMGFGGRVGLHSLPKAEPFYRTKCGMTDLGMDAKKKMVYFEMNEAQAEDFRQNKKKP